MAIDTTVKNAQDAQVGILSEATFGVSLDADADADNTDSSAYRRIPMATVTKPTFEVLRESRMLSGRGSIKDAGDTLLVTKGGQVTMPFEFIATPELMLQHLMMVGQDYTADGSDVYTVEWDGSSNKVAIGGAVTDRLPHTVNLAYMPSASSHADGIRINGVMVSDMTIKGDYGTNGGAITISGNYWSGFSHCTAGDGIAKSQLEQTFDGTWVDPDENVFFHMSDLKTKTLDIDGATNSDMLIKSFEINIVNNVQQLGGDGLGFPEMYVIPQFDITGNLVIKDDRQFDLSAGTNVLQSFFDKTTLSLALKFGDNTVSSVGEMNILAEIQLTGDPTQDTSSGVFWNLPFECLQNGSTEALKIQLFSDTAPTGM
tara:strand:+ start:4500 stop:5615 length:1116 start_codon:yes stop_codon:yes gene_type:complete